MFPWDMELVRFVASLRTPGLNALFLVFSFFDRQECFLLLLTFLWMGWGRRVGLRFFCIFALSGMVNFCLKQIVRLPRPSEIDPSLAMIQVGPYGLPSGGAQTAVLLSGLLLLYGQGVWKWPVGIVFFILLSLSRIYLGVHFPSDILAGWIVGAVLLALFVFCQSRWEYWIRHPSRSSGSQISTNARTLLIEAQYCKKLCLWGLLPPALLLVAFPDTATTLCSCTIGVMVGGYLGCRTKLSAGLPTGGLSIRLLRCGVGVAGLLLLSCVVPFLPSVGAVGYLWPFTLGIWVSFLADLLCRTLC